MKKLRQRLAIIAALGVPLLAAATPARPDPTDARATVPPLRYPSAYADYEPWQDLKPADWRAVNDRLRNGTPGPTPHVGHAMPAPAAGASAPAARTPEPMPADHAGHHGGRK